ncbi:MAG: hypothetical protein U0165_09400 [Polyangiaceae bacterium]
MLVRSLSKLVTLSFVVLLSMLPVAGCSGLSESKPKPGDACKRGTGACFDAKSQLACQDGKFIVVPCKGAGGCSENGGTLKCDITGNETGDACATEDDGTGLCTPDKKAMVKCIKGKYRRDECDGKQGCIENTCYAKMKVGDTCERGRSDCGDDKTEMICQAGKVIAVPCKGTRGCYEEGSQIRCDVSGNEAGDPCSTDEEGSGQCASDHKNMLKCEKGKYVIEACKGAKGCVTKGYDHTCYGR